MEKARKLKSGSWNVQVYDYTDGSGKKHCQSFTADTKAGAEYLAARFLKEKSGRTGKVKQNEITVGEAVDKYIALSEPSLSPTTIESYKKVRSNSFPELMDKKVGKLTDQDMQEAINAEILRTGNKTGRPISAKTLANEWGLISSSLKSICSRTYNIKLPKRQRGVRIELPTPDTVFQMIRGTDIELPCLLAMWLSFSLSEVRGLMYSDIQGNYITINRVLVDVEGYPEVKNNAKVDTRKRTHKLPPYIKQLIAREDRYKDYIKGGEDGFIITLTGEAIRRKLTAHCRANGIEGLTFHKLRHINASVMLMLNIPDKYSMERGGWKTPYVMHEVYQHTFSAERQKVDAIVDKYFEGIVSG